MAQTPRFVELTRLPDGRVLDYPADGVWRLKARGVTARREALLAADHVAALAAPSAAAGTALAGTLRIPALLLSFSDTDTTTSPLTAQFDSLYFGTTPLVGRTYSLRTFYQEMSNGLLNIEGTVAGWSAYDSSSTWWYNACGTGDPFDCPVGMQRTRTVFVDALTTMDATVDFGQFDNDGPDGIANSGDDDGVVDVAQFVQPVLGAECGGPGLGAHKFFLSGIGGAYATGDARTGGGVISVNAYHVVSGVGGAATVSNYHGCGDPGAIGGIGTTAHELGHGLGLPDLYDVGGPSEGIGEWGLMGSGNYTTANSPTHMEAWSRSELGWVAVVELTTAGTYTISPVVTSDTAYMVRPRLANPRGEYFLLENRQATGSDTANMLRGGNTGPKLGGLLIWQVDSARFAVGGNTYNSGSIHALALQEADGSNQLLNGANRGDAGDPWPGTQNRVTFGASSSPPPRLNANGAFAGLTIDSIRQVVVNGEMAFRLVFGVPLTVSVVGNGTVTGAGLTIPGTTFVSDTVTLTAAPDAGQVFDGWSGDTITTQPTIVLPPSRAWSVIATNAPVLTPNTVSPIAATMGASVQVALGASGGVGPSVWTLQSGTLPPGLTLNPGGLIAGIAEAVGSFSITLTARSGSQAASLDVVFEVSAPQLATADVVGALLGAAGLTTDGAKYLDLLGNRNGSLDLGDFLAWVQATGATPTADEIAAVFAGIGGDR